jgi:hypothetical protein
MIENGIVWRRGECQTSSKWQTIGRPSLALHRRQESCRAGSPITRCILESLTAGSGNLDDWVRRKAIQSELEAIKPIYLKGTVVSLASR